MLRLWNFRFKFAGAATTTNEAAATIKIVDKVETISFEEHHHKVDLISITSIRNNNSNNKDGTTEMIIGIVEVMVAAMVAVMVAAAATTAVS